MSTCSSQTSLGIDQCAICLEYFQTTDKIISLHQNEKVQHCFHMICIAEWHKKSKPPTCPLCKKNVSVVIDPKADVIDFVNTLQLSAMAFKFFTN